jgi:hypothetical protein
MADGLSAAGPARLHAAAEQHIGDEDPPGLVALAAHGRQRATALKAGPKARPLQSEKRNVTETRVTPR